MICIPRGKVLHVSLQLAFSMLRVGVCMCVTFVRSHIGRITLRTNIFSLKSQKRGVQIRWHNICMCSSGSWNFKSAPPFSFVIVGVRGKQDAVRSINSIPLSFKGQRRDLHSTVCAPDR